MLRIYGIVNGSAGDIRYPGNHIFLPIQDEVLIQSLVLDPDNDPIRDQMIREFPDDVTTR